MNVLSTRTTTGAWVILAALLLAGAPARAAYVLLPNNARVDGTDIRAKSDGEIILTTPQGQRSFIKGQYVKAVADKPADFDKASQLAAAKNYDEAAKILADIASKYKFLEWDNQANALLGKIYSAKGDYAAAAGAYEQIIHNSPEAAEDANLQWAYRAALLGAKQFDKLNPILADLITKGSRPDAARAQTMRGDVKLSQGQVEGALLDYLRTVTLFENERDARPEAMYKASQALDKLRDPRGAAMAKQLVEEYPESPFAEKVKTGK